MNVIHLISNKVWGGGARYALDLCRYLAGDGHNVKVYTRRKAAVRDEFVRRGLLGGTLRMGGAWDFLTPIRLASAIRRMQGPVVVHTHCFKDAYTALAARRLCKNRDDIRIVTTQHMVAAAVTDASHLRTYSELDAIIFVSETARREFMSTSPAVDSSRLHVVRGSVPAQTRERRDDGDSPLRLIYIGPLAAEKGLDVLLEALRSLAGENWILDIFGTGEGKYVMPLISMCKRTFPDGRVHWFGNSDDVPGVLANAHVAVVPSREPEAFCPVILEAFSQETAVISTDGGARTEIIDDGRNGMLVPAGDVGAMARAVKRLIDDSDLRRRLAHEGLESYRREYGYENFCNSILSIYNDNDRAH